MAEVHLLAKFPIGLTIDIEQDDGLVHQGEFRVNDLLDFCHSLIILGHYIGVIGIILLDCPVLLYNLVLSCHHLSNPFL